MSSKVPTTKVDGELIHQRLQSWCHQRFQSVVAARLNSTLNGSVRALLLNLFV